MIVATSTFLRAMITILKYHERKGVEIPQISHQPRVIETLIEKITSIVCYYVEIDIVLTKFE